MLAAIAALVLCAPAEADEYQIGDSGWRAQITPYGWAPSMKGKVRPTGPLLGGLIAPPTFHVDKPFKDILKDLDGAFFLHGTLRRDRFVIFGDFTWAAVSESHHSSFLGGLVPVSAKAKVTQTSGTLLAGYSLIQGPGFNFDVLGGARAWRVKASASASATFPVVGDFDLSLTRTASWVDPIIAARMRINFTPDWSLILYGDFGGFGVGAKSTWQVVGTVNYRVKENLFLSLGYRHMAFDYREDGKLLDLKMGGPIVGATWRF